MRDNFKKVIAGILLAVLVFATVSVLWQSRHLSDQQKAVAETRRSLREQGFKTDLADFHFITQATSPFESLLAATTMMGPSFHDHPNLMETTSGGAVIVVWQQAALKREYSRGPDNDLRLEWDEFRGEINANGPMLDDACDAALSGPIAFNLQASEGSALRLPHLAAMKNLTQILDSRAVLEIHDGRLDVAWTNLIAATRLVSAWNPEPAEISQLVRMGTAALAFNTLWQALQTNGWSDEQLARLQREWESVDYFKPLPETAAFKRVCSVADCQQERERALLDGEPIGELMKELTAHPGEAWPFIRSYRQHLQYAHQGSYEDEKNLLLFYRDREVELRNAIRAPTWLTMRQMPGATNDSAFKSPFASALNSRMNLRSLSARIAAGDSSVLARTAKAEAQRRVLVAALALERFRHKHGAYPTTLAALAPEFLPDTPLDFVDGQPLRYRIAEGGHFLLYSIGLDCVDNGGLVLSRKEELEARREAGLLGTTAEGDIAWPLPASANDVQALRRQEERAVELQNRRELERESAEDWTQSLSRQSRVAQILATKWEPTLDNRFFGGHPATEVLRNPAVVSNQLSLAELMTPRQVLTGQEPEDLTFEFPISYDAIGDHEFFLLVDAEMGRESMFAPDSGARVQERVRAPDGNCRLIWHTIFDPPGEHALQAQLIWSSDRGGETWCRGPAVPVTTTNPCQFSLDSSTYDVELGATFHGRLPEAIAMFSIECVTTNGEHLATLSGSTSNGEFNVVWNLTDDHGRRLTGETFNSILRLKLPDSGREQTMRGP